MRATLEQRVETLEAEVKDLKTNAGPGRADAHSDNLVELRKQMKEVRLTQADHTAQLKQVSLTQADHTAQLKQVSLTLADHTARLNGLEQGVRNLQGSMDAIEIDVTGLKTDFTEFKEEVSVRLDRLDRLNGRVDKIDAALAEILDRLPPKAA
jgi:chromosome segregation ATPase